MTLWKKNGFASPEAYAAEIKRKNAIPGAKFTNGADAVMFMKKNPAMFKEPKVVTPNKAKADIAAWQKMTPEEKKATLNKGKPIMPKIDRFVVPTQGTIQVKQSAARQVKVAPTKAGTKRGATK